MTIFKLDAIIQVKDKEVADKLINQISELLEDESRTDIGSSVVNLHWVADQEKAAKELKAALKLWS